mmetsp:Transcript_134296/g.287232  ORF Transcript_134296/g.287232 Transcript_134296/m.287232 type:complete len:275 (+) Transcript_134296:368-1192(+)
MRRIVALGRHIPGRASLAIELPCDVGAFHLLGEAEIADLGVLLGVEEDVHRFEIPVNDALGMQEVDAFGHVAGDRPLLHGHQGWILPRAEKAIVEGASGHELGDYKEQGWFHASTAEAHQAGVAEAPKRIDLLLHLLQVRHATDLLDRHFLAVPRAAIDLGRAPSPELRSEDELLPADELVPADGERFRRAWYGRGAPGAATTTASHSARTGARAIRVAAIRGPAATAAHRRSRATAAGVPPALPLPGRALHRGPPTSHGCGGARTRHAHVVVT